jgi:hypothetical protein
MRILTDSQAEAIIALLLDIEKTKIREQAVVDAERIRAIILQAEEIKVKLEQ